MNASGPLDTTLDELTDIAILQQEELNEVMYIEAREGNPSPRLWIRAGSINSMGLPNLAQIL